APPGRPREQLVERQRGARKLDEETGRHNDAAIADEERSTGASAAVVDRDALDLSVDSQLVGRRGAGAQQERERASTCPPRAARRHHRSIQETDLTICFGSLCTGHAIQLSSRSLPISTTPMWFAVSRSTTGSMSAKPRRRRSSSQSSALPVRSVQPGLMPCIS